MRSQGFSRPGAFVFVALLMGLLLTAPADVAGESAPRVKALSVDELRKIVHSNKGKVVLLNFWSTLSSVSREGIPLLNKLYEDYRDRAFEILSINVEGVEADVIAPFVEMMEMSYPVFVGRDDVVEAYDIQFVPITFVLGKDGKVRLKEIGFSEETEPKLRRLINTLLREG